MFNRYYHSIAILFISLYMVACVPNTVEITMSSTRQGTPIGTMSSTTPMPIATAQSDVDDPSFPTPTPYETPIFYTPTFTPTLTHTPSPITPSPAPLPLPDVAINVSPFSFPLFTCFESQELGQIWLSSFPYNEAQRLFANSNYALYDPQWSPDGQHLALIAINPGDISTGTQINGSWRYYKDTILIGDEDGVLVAPFDLQFARSEFTSFENNSCTVISGISSLIGWSPDGKWLAFTVLGEDEVGNTSLYIANIETGDFYRIAEDIEAATWQPQKGSLLVIMVDPIKVELISIDDRGVSEVTDMTPELLPEHIPTHPQFTSDGNKAFVYVWDYSSYYGLSTLWQLDLLNTNWTQISEVDFEDRPVLQLLMSEQTLFFCWYGGPYFLEMISLSTWDVFEGVEVYDCSVSLVPNLGNRPIIAFLSGRRTIDILSVTDLSFSLLQKIDGDLLNLPDTENDNIFRISSFSWKQ